jgi:hypothetical protein
MQSGPCDMSYLLEQGGPDADKVRAILAQSDVERGYSHE